jgi:RNA polymerase sigma-B factor
VTSKTELVRIEAGEEAPGLAREWLAGAVTLDRVRRAQALVLVSELVTEAVGASQSGTQIVLGVERIPSAVVVGVEISDGTELKPGGFTEMILEGFATSWGRDASGKVWFEVPVPGSADRGVAGQSTEELLRDLSDSPDSMAREELISRYTPMALRLARRYKGKGVHDDDVDQAAMFGLFQALSRYDSSRGPLEPFATLTITGELKRLLRDRGWSLTVPRQLKDRVLEVGRATQVLGQRLGRAATPEEIAAELDLDVDQVLEAQACSTAYQTGSLDAPVGDSDAPHLDPGDPDLDPGADWARHSVGSALAMVSEQERRLLHMRFYEDKTQGEIASALGISQMHVSRLLSRVLDRLQVLLED